MSSKYKKNRSQVHKRSLFPKIDAETNNHNALQDREPLKDHKQNGEIHQDLSDEYINYGLDDQMQIQGYSKDKIRNFLSWVFIVLTLGGVRLVFHWRPRWMLIATHRPCSLAVAEKILVTERYQEQHVCYHVKKVVTISSNDIRESINDDDKNKMDEKSLLELQKLDEAKLSVHVSGGIFKENDTMRFFKCKKVTYFWDTEELIFQRLRGLDWDTNASILHKNKGLSFTEQYFRRAMYGLNEIIVPTKSVMALLFLEVLHPFYIFQIFSFTLWAVDDYIYYAMAILILSCVSVGVAVNQTRKNQKNLSSRVHSSDLAKVLRPGAGEDDSLTISTQQLVPGDILIIPSHGCIMHCDAVLLTGNCIVNESMLTGESVPVTKTPIPNTSNVIYDEKEHARHTLFCGTQVIQTRYYGNERVYAVVIRTGFSTAKGNLVRSILYPPPVDFKFEQDSYKFIRLLAIVAFVGVVYTICILTYREETLRDIILNALDLITIVVPPALPAAMTVGRLYAQKRLEKSNIFCISPRTINVSGSINCICFDKTGTLTEDGLDMWGVVPVANSRFQVPVRDIKSLPIDHMLQAMATCHSLTIIDNNLAGDPLDIKMFESTGWILQEPEVSDTTKFDLISPTTVKPSGSNVDENGIEFEIGIVRQFTFSSSLQRMSVITRVLGTKNFTLYCKGSPEMILSLCDSNTVPTNFENELESYAKEGYRILGLAYKNLPTKLTYVKMQRLSREEAESGLTFLGFVVMENRLKPQTAGVLTMLRDAQIRTVMVTGDNMLTALSVARDCGIVPPEQRVIMVHTTNQHPKPAIYFTHNKAAKSPDTAHIINELSQLTCSESLTSLQTIPNCIPNGTARNSVLTDLPIDNETMLESAPVTDYSFALTGTTWTVIRSFYPELILKIGTRGAVFARMSPDHKQQLVQQLQKLDYFVAMVGDGANDCGALKAAHAGISLSDAESSVASPFTSKNPNISCIVEVIREGRAALVTAFAIFKYMAAYSLMQFASVIILYSIGSNLTDIEYLYIDLFVITTFAFVLGKVDAYYGPLYPKPPLSSLISFTPICSLVSQMVIAIGAQLLSFYLVATENWNDSPFNETLTNETSTIHEGYANYALFTVSSLQYIILALVFSKGWPYRQSLFCAPILMLASVLVTAFTLYLVICPIEWLQEVFELKLPPTMNFRLTMVGFGLINLILAVMVEFLCEKTQKLKDRFSKKLLLYESINKSMNEDVLWPPISTDPPLTENYEVIPRPSATVTVVNSPPGKRRLNSIGQSSSSDLNLDELKFSTPMKSVQSLMAQRNVGQSEDSLDGYLTPMTATPSHVTHL